MPALTVDVFDSGIPTRWELGWPFWLLILYATSDFLMWLGAWGLAAWILRLWLLQGRPQVVIAPTGRRTWLMFVIFLGLLGCARMVDGSTGWLPYHELAAYARCVAATSVLFTASALWWDEWRARG